MRELTRLYEKNDRFQHALSLSVENFRIGKDAHGLDDLLTSMDDLESILDFYACLCEPELEIKKMLTAMKILYLHMQNQDIIGMTDVLEDSVFPLSKEWIKGCDKV